MRTATALHAALLCVACADPAPPPVAEQAAEPGSFKLAGWLGLPSPARPPAAGFEGASERLGPECSQARRFTGGRSTSCSVELWRSTGQGEPTSATLTRAGQAAVLELAGQRLEHRARWRKLGPTMSTCLGDPLQLPPAGDPGGFRLLRVDADGPAWLLRFSGRNACALSGTLRLSLGSDGVDSSELQVDGAPWSDQGASRALAKLQAWTRAGALDEWPALADEQRVLLLQALSRDPHPEAAEILGAISEMDPSAQADVRRALQRRVSSQ